MYEVPVDTELYDQVVARCSGSAEIMQTYLIGHLITRSRYAYERIHMSAKHVADVVMHKRGYLDVEAAMVAPHCSSDESFLAIADAAFLRYAFAKRFAEESMEAYMRRRAYWANLSVEMYHQYERHTDDRVGEYMRQLFVSLVGALRSIAAGAVPHS